ncbi:MAG: hypothetical protein ABIL68_06015 [bacterium]
MVKKKEQLADMPTALYGKNISINSSLKSPPEADDGQRESARALGFEVVHAQFQPEFFPI